MLKWQPKLSSIAVNEKYIKILDSETLLPLVIEASQSGNVNDLEKWIKNNHEYINKQLDTVGGILFRGFNIKTAFDFEKIAKLIDRDLCTNHPFDGGARMWLTKYIYEADVTKYVNAPLPVPFHNEDSYVSYLPSTLMFCCLKPAEYGGESIISDCRKVFSSLPLSLQKKYSTNIIKMVFTHSDSIFLINSCIRKNEKEIKKLAKKYSASDCKRIGEDDTEFTFSVSPVIKTKDLNQTSYIGRVHFSDYLTFALDIFLSYRSRKKISQKIMMCWLIMQCVAKHFKDVCASYFIPSKRRYWCTFGNNKKIPFLDQVKITLAFWKNSVTLPLKSSDILVLNNLLISHGRLPYKGKRVILSCMGSLTATPGKRKF